MVVKDAVKPLREAIAWVLVSAALLQLILGLWALFEPSSFDLEGGAAFLYNAHYATSSFVGFYVATLLTAAALLVTVLPDRLPRAKAMLVVVTVEAGVMLLFGILTLFLGLFYVKPAEEEGEYAPDISGGEKAQAFFESLPELALTLIPLLIALAMLRAPELSGPSQPAPMSGGYYGPGAPQQYPGQPPYPGQQPPPPGQQQGYPGSYPQWHTGQGQQPGGYAGW